MEGGEKVVEGSGVEVLWWKGGRGSEVRADLCRGSPPVHHPARRRLVVGWDPLVLVVGWAVDILCSRGLRWDGVDFRL